MNSLIYLFLSFVLVCIPFSNLIGVALSLSLSPLRFFFQTKKGRNFEYFTTVNFEKRQRRRDYEVYMQESALKNESRAMDERSKPITLVLVIHSLLLSLFFFSFCCSYEDYAIPFQRTFDKAIDNSLQTLRGASLDERARRIREQFKQKIVRCSFLFYWVLSDSFSCY
jgi:hypothetical protein